MGKEVNSEWRGRRFEDERMRRWEDERSGCIAFIINLLFNKN
jgi:hypothetical protein